MARHRYSTVSFYALCLLLAGCSPPAGWELGPFPEKLALSRVIGSCQSGGFREGIAVAYIELSPKSAGAIEKLGLAYFEGMAVSRSGITLQPWARSPLEMPDGLNSVDSKGAPVYARPMFGCGGPGTIATEASLSAVSEFEAGRAFYTTFNHGEGLLVVAPRAAVAAYFYFG